MLSFIPQTFLALLYVFQRANNRFIQRLNDSTKFCRQIMMPKLEVNYFNLWLFPQISCPPQAAFCLPNVCICPSALAFL